MYQQMVFGQLGSYALNMRSFGVPKSKVDLLVRQLAVGNGLSEEMLQVRGPVASCERCRVRRVIAPLAVVIVSSSSAARHRCCRLYWPTPTLPPQNRRSKLTAASLVQRMEWTVQESEVVF